MYHNLLNKRCPGFLLAFSLLAGGILSGGICAQEVAEETKTAPVDLPSGEDVVAKLIEAMGGREKLESLKSSVAKGTLKIDAAGIEAPLELTQVSPDKLIVSFEFPGIGAITKCVDGDTVWENSAMTGPRIVEGKEKDQLIREADATAILHLDKYYKEIKCVDKVDVDGEACYKMELTTKEGDTEHRYVGVESGLVLKMEQTQSTQLGDIKIASTMSDYRDVDGLMTPFRAEQTVMGQKHVMEFESFEYNVEVASDKFDAPEEVQELMKDDADKK